MAGRIWEPIGDWERGGSRRKWFKFAKIVSGAAKQDHPSYSSQLLGIADAVQRRLRPGLAQNRAFAGCAGCNRFASAFSARSNWLIRYEATVDIEGLTSDVAGSCGSQEHHHGRDVLGLVGASQGYGRYVALLDLRGADALLLRHCRHQVEVEAGTHDAGAHGVDIDVGGSQLLRRRLGQADDGALAGGINGIGGSGEALAGDGGDVDDAATAARNHLTGDPLQAEEHAL